MTDSLAPTRSGRRIPFALVLVATGVPMFMATLDNLVMTNALPVIHQDLGASIEELQWFINAYTLAFASFILMAVALGDRFGRRTVFMTGIAIFTLASIAAALSTDPTQLIVARAIQGFGGAAIMPLSLVLLAGSVEPQAPAARDRHLGRNRGPRRRGRSAHRRRRARGLELAGHLLDQRARRPARPSADPRGAAQQLRRQAARRRRRPRARRARRARDRVRHRARQRRGLGQPRGDRLARRGNRATRGVPAVGAPHPGAAAAAPAVPRPQLLDRQCGRDSGSASACSARSSS